MKILKFSSQNFKKAIEISIKLIKKGKVLVFPTDTVYGLLANAKNERVVKRVFGIKKRPKGRPIPVFVRDLKMAKELAFISKKQESFLKEVWPGKVTVVLKQREDCGFPKILLGKTQTIGLRIPNYKLVNNLLEKLNFPLTGTSANISGKPASTKIKEVINQFKNTSRDISCCRSKYKKVKPDLVLDAGNLKPSLPSTVIDLTKKSPKILRRGEISEKEILKVFNRLL